MPQGFVHYDFSFQHDTCSLKVRYAEEYSESFFHSLNEINRYSEYKLCIQFKV